MKYISYLTARLEVYSAIYRFVTAEATIKHKFPLGHLRRTERISKRNAAAGAAKQPTPPSPSSWSPFATFAVCIAGALSHGARPSRVASGLLCLYHCARRASAVRVRPTSSWPSSSIFSLVWSWGSSSGFRLLGMAVHKAAHLSAGLINLPIAKCNAEIKLIECYNMCAGVSGGDGKGSQG